MATNKPRNNAELSVRQYRRPFIASNKNIAGAGLAVVGAVSSMAAGMSGLYPAVIAGALYGIGLLVVPRQKFRFDIDGAGHDDPSAMLRHEHAALAAQVDSLSRRLPADVRGKVATIVTKLGDVVERGSDLVASPDYLSTVENIMTDYLPTSLESYANLPPTYAMSRRVEGKRTAHDELMIQLDLLDGQIDDIFDSILRGDVSELADKGRFLQDKFKKSSLDLDP